MATLGLIEQFNARHGTKNVRTDNFKVEIGLSGNIINGFVGNIDYTTPKNKLQTILSKLDDSYLDDIVGRATNENIASYIIFMFNHPALDSITVFEGTNTFVQLQQSELNFRDYPAQLHLNKAQSLLLRANPSAAINESTQAINLNDKFTEAYNLRGRCFKYLGFYQLALLDYQRAISLNPEFGEAHRNLGNIYDYLHKDNLMIPTFTKAIELLQSALTYNNRGYAYQKLGEYKLAIKDHTTAIDLDLNYAEAYSDRASANKAVGNDDLATKDLEKAKELKLTKKDTYLDIKFYY